MRVVLDPNVLVSAAISPAGPPRQILTAWTNERFDLIVSPAVLDELADVLARPGEQLPEPHERRSDGRCG